MSKIGKKLIEVPTDVNVVIEGKTIKNQEITLEVVNYSEKAVLKDIIKK